MRRSALRGLSWIMVLLVPGSLFGGEATPGAMLYAHGGTFLNGITVPRSSALFTGDLVQTGAESVANINATGSTVLVLNESLVQYEGNSLKLEHGGIKVSTSKSLFALAGQVKVAPAKAVPTEFEVKDVDGRVQIAARKGDLTISDGASTSVLAQGQETTRDESPQSSNTAKGKGRRQSPPAGAEPGLDAAILNSPIAVGVAAGAIVGVTTWVLLQNDDPASPTK